MKEVEVGETIYVDTSLYLSHGADDFCGGKAKIDKVFQSMSGGIMTTFITVEEHPGTRYNWGQILSKKQEKLAEQFGEEVAHPDPDYREEFNRWD